MVRVIFLCGGLGRRFGEYSPFCKPLTLLWGRPMFEYTLKPFIDRNMSILIAYNTVLEEQNFEEQVRAVYPEGRIDFYQIPYLTEGAVETGLLAVNSCIKEDESIIFFDNDAIYRFDDDFVAKLNTNFTESFLGYSDIEEPLPCYCYMKIEGDHVKEIREKEIISNHYGIGVYGFHSSKVFEEEASYIIRNKIKMRGEYYFSALYAHLLGKGMSIEGVRLETPIVLGTPEQVRDNLTNDIVEEHSIRGRRIYVSSFVKERCHYFLYLLETCGFEVVEMNTSDGIILSENSINMLEKDWKKKLGLFVYD